MKNIGTMEKHISGHIVDVLKKEIYDGTITVNDGKIAAIRKETVGEDAPFILPGLVDSHVHIESTLLTPGNFAALAVSKGVVAVVSDPHEIANVTGLEGVDFMISNGKKVHFHFNFGASPCVPCTGFETSGAILDSKDIAALLERDDIYGLAEFMNAFGLVNNDPECVAKIEAARRLGKPVDGHAPGLSGEMLRKYIEAGVSTDHECTTLDECRERLALGMSILIREGSAACDYDNLCPLLGEYPDHIMFCSDDKYPDELAEGYIDTLVRLSISKDYPVWNVLNAACTEPVAHYALKHGVLREGDGADFITVDSLRSFNVLSTWIDGLEVYSDGKVNMDNLVIDNTPTTGFPNNFHAEKISSEDIRIRPEGSLIKVITATDKSLRTGVMTVPPLVSDGNIVSDTGTDVLKMLVYNRYTKSRPQVAFINGFSLKRGAMASTIAHDSHNIVAVGTSDEDIVNAVNRLVELQGGMVITDGDKVCEMPLPVAGLMSTLDGKEAAAQYGKLKDQALAQGCPFKAPFMTMSFMALPVIPSLKITDKGLFDVDKFEFTDVCAG